MTQLDHPTQLDQPLCRFLGRDVFSGTFVLTLGLLLSALTLASCGTDECEEAPDSVFCKTPSDRDQNGNGNGGDAICAEQGPGTSCGENLTCNAAGRCACGNGVVDTGEQCDGGERCSDECLRTCSAAADCPASECREASTCNAQGRCQVGAPRPQGTACTDGVCDARGNCDTSITVDCATAPPGTECGSNLTCNAARQCACGNGVIDPGEECDGGPNCSAVCLPFCSVPGECPSGGECRTASVCAEGGLCQFGTPRPQGTECTNGVCDANGNCDTGNGTVDCGAVSPGTACGTDLTCNTVGECTCGNGVVDPGEECDGGPNCTDACLSVCTANADCESGGECRQPSVCDNQGRCQLGAPKAQGSACAGGFCDATGNCLSCNRAGEACQPTNPCFEGVIACVDGSATCQPTVPKGFGLACGAGLFCDGTGNCGACPGQAGRACTPANRCEVGIISCASGVPACRPTANAPAGNTCGDNQICDGQGVCVSCDAAGQSCQSSNRCKTAQVVCQNGSPICSETGNRSANTSCAPPAGSVCDGSGQCVTCANAGASCTLGQTCREGRVVCTPGGAQCVEAGLSPAGTSCGIGGICDGQGGCVGCGPGDVGSECVLSTNPCLEGTIQCPLGVPLCQAATPARPRPSGTPCGTGQVCDGQGTCAGCQQQGLPCASESLCRGPSSIQCDASGQAVCEPGAPLAFGTQCGQGRTCDGRGECVACPGANGSACESPDACLAGGTLVCNSLGQLFCADSEPEDFGTPCGSGLFCDGSGSCVGCAAAGTACQPGNVCRTGGVIACDAQGNPSCSGGSNAPSGTVCGENAICDGQGNCRGCDRQGEACTPEGNVCALGVIACTGFDNVRCEAVGFRPPGSQCGAEANRVCSDGGECITCDAPPGPEVCDGRDNNCDGTIDKGLTAPLCELQAGVCAGARKRCGGTEGFLACTAADYGPSYRAVEGPNDCDGLDNDCDGQVDEACVCAVGTTRPCGTNVGACSAGVQTCNRLPSGASDWGACVGAVPPTPEVCDGVDNNCNGVTDEGCPCVVGSTQPCGSNVGECRAGTQTCTPTGFGQCVGAVGPTPEVCDGRDNNCNGVVDDASAENARTWYIDRDGDGFGTTEVTKRACTRPPGYAPVAGDCDDNNPARFPGNKEICDGLDNNCNGIVDSGGVCPNTCSVERWRGKSYLFCENRLTWDQATTFCFSQGYYLATINDAEEHLKWSQRVGIGPGGAVWIGGTERAQRGVWRWIQNNEQFFQSAPAPQPWGPRNGYYTNWNSGEPNNFRGPEECLQIRENYGQRGWNDVNCNTASRFLCERD